MNIRMSILQQPYKHYIFKSFSCQSDRMAYYFIFVFNVYLKELMTVSLFHRVGQWKLVNCLILVLTQSMLLCCPWLSMTVSCPKWICLIWAAPSKYWSLGLCLAPYWLSPQPASSSDLPCARRLLMSPLDTTSAEDTWYPHICAAQEPHSPFLVCTCLISTLLLLLAQVLLPSGNDFFPHWIRDAND